MDTPATPRNTIIDSTAWQEERNQAGIRVRTTYAAQLDYDLSDLNRTYQ